MPCRLSRSATFVRIPINVRDPERGFEYVQTLILPVRMYYDYCRKIHFVSHFMMHGYGRILLVLDKEQVQNGICFQYFLDPSTI